MLRVIAGYRVLSISLGSFYKSPAFLKGSVFEFSQMPKERRAAGFVIYRRISGIIEYLLLQTSYGKHHWTPPKGHVDPGESDIETAWRETEEESGLKQSDLELKDFSKILQYEVKGAPKTVIYWLAELIKDTPVKLSDEHQDFKWLPLTEACAIAEHKDTQDLLQDCNKYLSGK